MIFRRDWKTVLLHAWSVRFFALTLLVQAIDVGLPYFRDWLPLGDISFGLITMAFCIAGTVARLVPQRGISEDDP